MLTDYSSLTESVGCKISREQLQRMYTRYAFAAIFSEGKDVLEVACGIGQGLGLLAAKARSVSAGDYTQRLVEDAKAHYGDRFDIRQLDAHHMPFAERSFDVVILYEAIYYLHDPQQFLAECRRVLRPGGAVVICSANKDWSGFSPSPHSFTYFNASELYGLMSKRGFSTTIYGDCPVSDGTLRCAITSAIRRVVVRSGLMPDNLKAREKFKRIFFGKLLDMPRELTWDNARDCALQRISHHVPAPQFKVIFAVGVLAS